MFAVEAFRGSQGSIKSYFAHGSLSIYHNSNYFVIVKKQTHLNLFAFVIVLIHTDMLIQLVMTMMMDDD